MEVVLKKRKTRKKVTLLDREERDSEGVLSA